MRSVPDANRTAQGFQFPEMDRRERASSEAAGRQQEGVRKWRNDCAGGRRPERARSTITTIRSRSSSISSRATWCSKSATTAVSTMCRSRRATFFCCRRTCGIRRSGRAGSIGLVVEPHAPPTEKDAFEWYCFECGTLVHRIEVKVTHSSRDLPPLYEAFFTDEKARTCKKCGAVHPGKKPPARLGPFVDQLCPIRSYALLASLYRASSMLVHRAFRLDIGGNRARQRLNLCFGIL